MLLSRPDYYGQFQCTADMCEDTCCAGWQIVVDKKNLKKYKKAVKNTRISEGFRRQLHKGVDWKEGVFRQDTDRRCAFLNGENLCDMYTNLGKDSLCVTCRCYPRHIEEFENVREISLSLSCPEVAKILMNRMKPVTFQEVEIDREEEYEEFDFFLYSQLLDTRNVLLEILQNRMLSLEVRQRLIYGIAHDIQCRVKRQDVFSCPEVLEKYRTERARVFVEKKLQEEKADRDAQFGKRKKMFRKMFQLEVLKQEWDIQLLEVERYLYLGHTVQEYEAITEKFHKWIKDNDFPWNIQKEQILVYFIYTYFCGAVYDEQILAKVKMALMAAEVIEEILKVRWIKNEEMIDMEDVIDVVYHFSREVEHSDDNLKKLEELNKNYQ